MKIKFSRIMAIGCALSVAFAGLTAFADVSVNTITSYDYEAANMTVTTTVSGLTDGTEVTYYVSKDAANTDIVYINQDTAASNKVEFSFTGAKTDILLANARYGSDAGINTFPTFYFNDGCNYLTSDTLQNEKDTVVWGTPVTAESEYGVAGYAFKGAIKGPAQAYGIEVGGQKLAAMGCSEAGVYVIIVEGITEADAQAAVPYIE